MNVRDRYQRDPEFHALVELMYASIHENQYTPTELREAAIFAATKYAMNNSPPPPLVIFGPLHTERRKGKKRQLNSEGRRRYDGLQGRHGGTLGITITPKYSRRNGRDRRVRDG